MRMARLACQVVSIPYKYPLMDREFRREFNFLELEVDGGLTGHAVSSYVTAHRVKDFINHEAAPLLVGMDAWRPEAVRARLATRSKKYHTGMWSCAASLIDIALWDARGKHLGLPIWKLLGGRRDKAPVYITFGVPAYDADQLVEAAKLWVSRGFDTLKMALAGGSDPIAGLYGQPTDADLRADVARVRAVREAVGDDVEIAIDANQNPTQAQALWLARHVEDFGIAWFEDALPGSDPHQLAQLRKRTATPIAAGSTGTCDLMRFREYLLHESVDILQVNVRDIGGFTGGLKAAAVAESFGMTVDMAGGWPALNAHLHGGAASGGRVEYMAGAWMLTELFDGLVFPEDGWIDMPQAPGLGYALREGVVTEFAIEEP